MHAIRGLVTSRNPLIAAIFGVGASRWQHDPNTNLRILRRVERQVYGVAGLETYEAGRPPEHERLMRRSFAQYLCQRALYRNRGAVWIRSLLGGMAVAPLVVWLVLRHWVRGEGRAAVVDVVAFVHFQRLRPVFAPHYNNQASVFLYERDGDLSIGDLAFLVKALGACPRALLYPVFLIGAIRWIADYGRALRSYRPKCVANLMEGSPSGSIATAYLREHGVRHCNHMHGERFFLAGYAFCEFDIFHVWGRYFQDLFIRLRCSPHQFAVTGNAYHELLFQTVRRMPADSHQHRLLIVHNLVLAPRSRYYRSLIRVLSSLDEDWQVRVRMHSNERPHGEALLRALQAEPELQRRGLKATEEPEAQSPLEASLAWSSVVVGAYTTALLEAWVGGRKIIHVEGEIPESVVMERYRGSMNVLFAGEGADIVTFLNRPAVINREEDLLVDEVTQQRLSSESWGEALRHLHGRSPSS